MARLRKARGIIEGVAALAAALCHVGCAGGDARQQAAAGAPAIEAGRLTAAALPDLSPPLRALAPAPALPVAHPAKPFRAAPRISAAPDPLLQLPRSAVPSAAPPLLQGFDGMGLGFSGPQGTFTVNGAPPDPAGDVGPNHYVQIVNTGVTVFGKDGAALYGPVPTHAFWTGVAGMCARNDDGDGTVVYDSMADRWVIAQFSVTGSTTSFQYCVAVSQTPDPTGAYYRYVFEYANIPDYAKLSLWPDAYYATFNMFDSTGVDFVGGEVCAYDRASMLAGRPATQQCFNVGASFGGLLAAHLNGPTPPPPGAPEPVVALGAAADQLAAWSFHVDWAAPANSTLSGPRLLATAPFSDACAPSGTCIPQSGTTQLLDSLGDRLMYRLAYRNFGDHQSLVANHSIVAGNGVGVRWYELRLDPDNVPSIFQQGTYAPDANDRWMGSIAMDKAGDMAVGFSVSGTALHPQIHFAGRLAGDALGELPQGEGTIIDGAGSQTGSRSGASNRWGDYTSMVVDPSDDCTFWYTDQYIPVSGLFNWKTRIASFRFPGCGGCAPLTRCDTGRDCGTIPDGCGGTVSCGPACAAPQSCGGGGTPNRCGCTPATSCGADQDCGTVPDGCGGAVACGSCAPLHRCDQNRCVSPAVDGGVDAGADAGGGEDAAADSGGGDSGTVADAATADAGSDASGGPDAAAGGPDASPGQGGAADASSPAAKGGGSAFACGCRADPSAPLSDLLFGGALAGLGALRRTRRAPVGGRPPGARAIPDPIATMRTRRARRANAREAPTAGSASSTSPSARPRRGPAEARLQGRCRHS